MAASSSSSPSATTLFTFPSTRRLIAPLPHLPKIRQPKPLTTRTLVSSPPNKPTTTSNSTTASPSPSRPSSSPSSTSERVFFDGGAHYGDLVTNLLFGFTLVWLPLTIAAVSRAFFLRYRFTNLRVTVVSGFTGRDRSDFPYKSIKDVQVVPRFVGEWGDIVISLKDGTVVDLRSVPKFREIANYCLYMKDQDIRRGVEAERSGGPRGF